MKTKQLDWTQEIKRNGKLNKNAFSNKFKNHTRNPFYTWDWWKKKGGRKQWTDIKIKYLGRSGHEMLSTNQPKTKKTNMEQIR